MKADFEQARLRAQAEVDEVDEDEAYDMAVEDDEVAITAPSGPPPVGLDKMQQWWAANGQFVLGETTPLELATDLSRRVAQAVEVHRRFQANFNADIVHMDDEHLAAFQKGPELLELKRTLMGKRGPNAQADLAEHSRMGDDTPDPQPQDVRVVANSSSGREVPRSPAAANHLDLEGLASISGIEIEAKAKREPLTEEQKAQEQQQAGQQGCEERARRCGRGQAKRGRACGPYSRSHQKGAQACEGPDHPSVVQQR